MQRTSSNNALLLIIVAQKCCEQLFWLEAISRQATYWNLANWTSSEHPPFCFDINCSCRAVTCHIYCFQSTNFHNLLLLPQTESMVAFSVNTLPSTRIRYRCVFKLFHFGERFQIVPYSVNTIPSFSAYPCGREVKTERFCFVFDEYASVWTGPEMTINPSCTMLNIYVHLTYIFKWHTMKHVFLIYQFQRRLKLQKS